MDYLSLSVLVTQAAHYGSSLLQHVALLSEKWNFGSLKFTLHPSWLQLGMCKLGHIEAPRLRWEWQLWHLRAKSSLQSHLWSPVVGCIEWKKDDGGSLWVAHWHRKTGRCAPSCICRIPTSIDCIGADGCARDHQDAACGRQDRQEWVQVDGPGCSQRCKRDVVCERVAAWVVDDVGGVVN